MRWKPPDLDALVTRYRKGDSVAALARDHSVHRGTIKATLEGAGVHVRDLSAAMRVRHAALPPEKRKSYAAAAAQASVGRRQSFETLCRIAQGKEANERFEEREPPWWLPLGAGGAPRSAIGPYNPDYGDSMPPVAIEIIKSRRGLEGGMLDRLARRVVYYMQHGWQVLVVRQIGVVGEALRVNAKEHYFVMSLLSRSCEYRVLSEEGTLLASGTVRDDYESVRAALAKCRPTKEGRECSTKKWK